MMIVRYTVGFHRYDTEFSDRYAADFLGMSRGGVNWCINKLLQKKYIYIISHGCGPHPRKIGLNYKEISAQFQQQKRSILKEKALNIDGESAQSNRAKKGKEIINTIKEKEKRFASEPISLSDTDELIENDENELTPEEWWELHKGDEL